jgi:cytochrome c
MTVRTVLLGTMLTIGMAAYALAEDPAAAYKAQCAKCHGETGEADTQAGKTLKVPPIKGDAKLAGMSVDELVKAAKANEKHKSFINKISDADLTAGATRFKEIAAGK